MICSATLEICETCLIRSISFFTEPSSFCRKSASFFAYLTAVDTMSAIAPAMAAPKVRIDAASHWMIFMTMSATAWLIRSMICLRTSATSLPAPSTAAAMPWVALESDSMPPACFLAAAR